MGPAVDEKQWQTDFDYIAVGKQEGARLVVGGRRPAAGAFGSSISGSAARKIDPDCGVWRRRQRGREGEGDRGAGRIYCWDALFPVTARYLFRL